MVEGDMWKGENPFYLVISTMDENINIDLDESGWMAAYADKMRLPGQWLLVHKATNHQALAILVAEGEQPYYTARHVGVAGNAGSNEIVAYGIGKKRIDGHVDRLWILPTGTVCAGDDVSDIGIIMVKRIGPRQ